MASIDAFLEWGEALAESRPLRRESLRRLGTQRAVPGGSQAPSGDRVIASVIGIVLLVLVFVALAAAMLPSPITAMGADTPLLISILPPPAVVVPRIVLPPPVPVTPNALPAPTTAPRELRTRRVPPAPARSHPMALQAVALPPPPAPARLNLYRRDGELQLPPPPPPKPRDLLGERSFGRQLPGSDDPHRAGFAFDTRSRPKKAAQAALMVINFITGGPGPDPCDALRQQMTDLDHPSRMQEADDRYAQHCQGR